MTWVLFVYVYAAVPYKDNLKTAGNGGAAIEHIITTSKKKCEKLALQIEKEFSSAAYVKVLRTRCFER